MLMLAEQLLRISEVQAQRNSVGTPVGSNGCTTIIAGAGLTPLYSLEGTYDPANILFDNATDNMVAVLRLNPTCLTVHFVNTTGATVAGSTFRFPILI